jgi:hypothetical protein
MKKILMMSAMLLVCSMAGAQVKSVSILGDSYSTFEGFLTPGENAVWYFENYNPKLTDVQDVTQTWWHLLIRKQGWQLCMNNSFSGSTICNTGYNKENYTDRSFVTRMKNLGCPDVIFIFGATNDSWAKSPIGEYKYDGITQEDLWQFRPAMARMLGWMQKRYVNTEIYFILNDGLSDGITSSAKTICRQYGVKCIELKDIDKKAGHPSLKGMQQIADQVGAAVGRGR